ncbi:MAG: hypothetical protein QF492_06555 [Candidatus Krumholzibacteria bacterium]|nr:hypothetical protein [Candidatus Krumholzibacteria bacterium]MDP6669546.1 hypothetical protein [Candidatus Krumholzibacteria bacterium]MDP6796371.1 hypothetical protein [Candidatus Krumholzibacteria bacterium]MDP7020882.1 hypothetical protein [Candidatus Krumholzibacteria bacterium]
MVSQKSGRHVREDAFVDRAGHYAALFMAHKKSVIASLTMILIVIAAVSLSFRFAKESELESRQSFASALGNLELALDSNTEEAFQQALAGFEAVGAEYPKRTVGAWTLYYSGFCKERLQQFEEARGDYSAYLSAEPEGEFELAALQGIASCEHSLRNPKKAADLYLEISEHPRAWEELSLLTAYKASKIYLDSRYFDLAGDILSSLKEKAKGKLLLDVQRDLEALAVLNP